MSAPDYSTLPLPLRHKPYPVDDSRGTFCMWLFIASEACLFGGLFGAYWYTGKFQPVWPPDPAPKLHYAIPSLFILLLSGGVMYWGELQLKKQSIAAAKFAMSLALLGGFGYIAFTILDMNEHLQTLAANADSYSSIFYTTEVIHAAHVCIGILMMVFVLALGKLEPRSSMPHRPYHNVALYWYFVVFTMLLLVIFLYIIPFVRR
jgi:cytochrome c oxidase subunit III